MKEEFSKIQNDYKMVSTENVNLKSRNDILERQIVRYAELFTEEKAEKKDILNRYESLQNEFKTEIENHSSIRERLMKRYYSILVLCCICLVLLLVFVAPNVLERLFPK